MLTELQIINAMLATVGTGGLTAEDHRHPYYVSAKDTLDAERLKVLQLRHWYNTVTKTLKRDSNKHIYVPSNTLKIDAIDTTLAVAQRGRRLYLTETSSYEFEHDVECSIVENMEVEDLPSSAVMYLRARARYMYYLDKDGAQPKLSYYAQDVREAWSILNSENINALDVNHFNGAGSTARRRGFSYDRVINPTGGYI